MSSVTTAADHLEQEAAGEIALELVAVRYTGSHTIYNVEQHLTQAGWPGSAPLDGGPTADADGAWQFALMPDSGLAHLEGRTDLDVVYADQRERFAEVLLEQSALPENVFGRGANQDLQNRVTDALDLDPPGESGLSWADQLRAIVGDDEAAAEDDAPEERSLAGELADAYTRHELGDICKELREDPSAFNLQQNAGKTDRAEYIAGFDREERAAAVEAAIDDADGGDGE